MKIKHWALALVLILLSCTPKERLEKSFWKTYDNSDWDNATKAKALDSLHNHIVKQANDSLTRNSLFRLAARYERLELADKYYQSSDLAQKWATAQKDTLDIAKALWYKGDYHDAAQVYDSAFHYYSQAEKYYRLSQKDSLGWGRMLYYKAGALYSMGIYTESEVESVKAMEVFSKLSTDWYPYQTKLQMALILSGLREYEEALKYYHLALADLKAIKNNPEKVQYSLTACYNNIGGHYNKMKNYKEAKFYLEKGLAYHRIEEEPDLHAMLLNNYAYSKMQLGERHQVDSLLSLSLRLRDSIGHKQGIIASKLNIGEYNLRQKDTLQAIETIKEAYALAQENQSHLDIQRSLEFLSLNDQANKAYYTQRYIEVKDSIREVERATKKKFARIEFETEQLSLENEVLLKRNTVLAFLSLGAILLILVLSLVYYYRMKNKRLQIQQKEQQKDQEIYGLLLREKQITQEAISKERQRISMELHDGVVNKIFAVRINLERLNSKEDALREAMVQELVRATDQIRDISHDLQESLFSDKENFANLLKKLVEEQKELYPSTSFSIRIEPSLDWSQMEAERKIHIYRIIQEALHNLNKHAFASKSFVYIGRRNNGKVYFRVHDDGVGFNPEKKRRTMGIKSIRKRVEELGGELNIRSQKGNTTIEFIIPLWHKYSTGFYDDLEFPKSLK